MSNFTQALKELTGFDNDVQAEGTQNFSEAEFVKSQETTKAKVAFDSEFDFDEHVVDVVEDEANDDFFFEPSEGATEISSTMIVSGDIKTSDDLLIEGFIVGNITSTGNVKTSGKQIGDLKALNALMIDAKQKGDIVISEKLSIEGGSIVQGNVKCGDINIDSKIKGDIDAKGKAAILPEAQIVGNVAADTIKTYPGAKINGTILVRSAIEDFDIDLDLEIGGDI